MRKIVCFGEALIDFLNTGQRLEDGLSLNSFDQFPGGAPANAAVAVAKLGGLAKFAGQVGGDVFGHFLIDALQNYGVDTSLAQVHPTAPTALAFVILDSAGERSFSFRRENTADLIFQKTQVSAHWFEDEPILHFCSNTLTETSIADVTRHVVAEARRQRAVVSFDVNLRHNLWQSGSADKELITELINRCDLVKFSVDELDYLSDGSPIEFLAVRFAAGLSAALITDGPGQIEIHTVSSIDYVMPPIVEAVDTTGGGDAFIGALLFGLSQQVHPMACLRDSAPLSGLVEFAAHCGAMSVTQFGAFPSFPVFSDVEKQWKL